ncbi:hypothetical protein Hanom_Chr12g01139701 [Helianthus anomalus]
MRRRWYNGRDIRIEERERRGEREWRWRDCSAAAAPPQTVAATVEMIVDGGKPAGVNSNDGGGMLFELVRAFPTTVSFAQIDDDDDDDFTVNDEVWVRFM